jgi:uncharacterized protein YndB with AHSA1/START domain
MTQETDLAVRRSVTVNAPPERAFAVFAADQTSWWPKDSHHIGEREPETIVLEDRAGGRWFERDADGVECDWGKVLEYDPPHRLVLAWQLGPDWAYDPDLARATRVEVTFVAEDGGRTRVDLEHSGFEVHGEHAEALQAPIAGDGGWSSLLKRLAATVEAG